MARSPHGVALGHLFTVLVAAAVIVAPQDLAWGRRVGWQLTGTELLLEMAKIGEGPNPAGIYSWSSEGGFQRVVVYGRRPRWSPDHGAFLYWEGGRLWRLRLREGVPVPLSLPDTVLDDQVEWLPDGSGLAGRLYWTQGANGTELSLYPVRLPVVSPLYERQNIEYVGRWSCSRDMTQIAYELMDPVPGFGACASTVRIAQIGGAEYQDVVHPMLEGCVVFNPQWQPGGDELALEAYQPGSGRQHVFLYHTRTRVLRQVGGTGVSATLDWGAADNARLVRWAPSGEEVLVLMRASPVASARVNLAGIVSMLWVVPVDGPGPMRQLGGVDGVLVAAAWSADSHKIAYVRSRKAVPWVTRSEPLRIWRRGAGTEPDSDRDVSVPDGLAVVELSW